MCRDACNMIAKKNKKQIQGTKKRKKKEKATYINNEIIS